MGYLIFAAGILCLFLALMAKGFYDNQKEEAKFVEKLREEYGKMPQKEYSLERSKSISGYYQKHREGFTIDDITWNDLDMDEVLKQLDTTLSSAGEEYLYSMLRKPCMEEKELLRREKIITWFMEHEQERSACQLLFSKLGHTGKFSLYDYLDYLDRLGERKNGKHIVALVLLGGSVGLMFFRFLPGFLALLCVLIYNYITYFKIQKEIAPYLTSFSYLFRLFYGADKLQSEQIPVLEEEFCRLRRAYASMGNFRRGAFLLMSRGRAMGAGSPLDMVFDFLRMGTHMDLMKFNQMVGEVRKHLAEIDEIITILGEADALIAVGAYRIGKSWVAPEFIEEQRIVAEGLYHPLLTDPVKCDLQTEKSILITGSNASGKSTFLKTIALNAIFSQTIHTVLANRWKSTFWRVRSSMVLRDDIQGGSSYYMAEIRSVKRIMDESAEGTGAVLCFIDEVLRGTNTVERIAASVQILRRLADAGGICFAATHDVELTYLLEDCYENYHFSEEMNGDDIFFSYRLLKGRSGTRNAIKLLSIMGYDKELIQDADALAQEFLKTGSWQSALT